MSLRIIIYNDLKNLNSVWYKFEQQGLIPDGFQYKELIEWLTFLGNYNDAQLGYNKKQVIVVAYKDQIPALLLPLMLVSRYKKKIKIVSLEFLSQSFNWAAMDIISSSLSDLEIKQVFQFIKNKVKYHYINLSYLPQASIIIRTLRENIFYHSAFLVVPISISYEKIRKEYYSKNLRHILNKFEKRINNYPMQISKKVLIGKSEILPYKEKIKKVSISKLQSYGMHSVYEDETKGIYFFNKIINTPNVFCSIYELDNELLAYNLGFIKNDVVFAVDAAYNRNFGDSQKIGLGILAYDNIVQKFALDYSKLNMGPGLDDYKFRFTKKSELTYTFFQKGNKILSKFWFKFYYKRIIKNERNIKNILKKIKK